MAEEFQMTNDECAERGIYAASTSPEKCALKRAIARAPQAVADFVIRASSFFGH
jgi:hypothetical protein